MIEQLTSGLTDQQARVYLYILNEFFENQRLPSMKEISSALGWRSPNSAYDHVTALIKKKRLILREGTVRPAYKIADAEIVLKINDVVVYG